MGTKIANFLTGFDIYGHGIGVHHDGSGAYKTRLGAFLTLATFIVMIVNMTNLSIAFYTGSDQSEKAQ